MKNSQYLSKHTTTGVKGILALAIVLCHIRGKFPELNGTVLGMLLTSFGYLSVGMFLFYTAYGLRLSSVEKGKTYIDNFVQNRILPFYAKCVFSVILYTIFFSIFYRNFPSLSLIIHSLTWGETIVEYGWFLHSILLVYIIFLLCYKIQNSAYKSIWAFTVGMIAYTLICIFTGLNSTTYEFVVAFLLGIVWYDNQEKIDQIYRRYGRRILFSSAIVFGITTCIGNYHIFWWSILIKMISAATLPVVVNTLLYLSTDVGTFVRYFECVGERSLEIYIFQGIVILTFGSIQFIMDYPILYCVIVIVGTISASYILHPIFLKIEQITESCISRRE